MQTLWIIGNSGAARECFWLFRDMLSADAVLASNMNFGGFLGWRGHEGDLKSLQDQYRGEALEYPIAGNDVFVIAIGEPYLREDVYLTMKQRDAKFFTLIHPWSDVTPSADCGEANVFQRGSTVFCDVKIGNANYLNGAANISHDASIGDYNFFGPYALVLGGCKVGSRNVVAVRSTLLANARIGNDNIITPGSIVYKGCRDNRRMVGNPALPMKPTTK